MLFLLLLVVFMFGCVAHYYSKPQSLMEYFTKPDIGVESTAFLGEPIVLNGSGYYANGIYIKGYGSCSAGLFDTITINEGFYELIHSDNMYNYYHPEDKDMIIWSTAHGRLPGGKNIRIGKDNSLGVSASTSAYANASSIKNNFIIETKTNYFITKKNSIQQTVIYTGKQDNILKFSYREFSDDMARPAFTTDITYDTNESNIIGFKSFRAEVIEATNTEIKYKIINGF